MTDVLIIGGGVIGLSTAYELAGQGVSVAVLEQGQFGREASWAGAGILPPGNPHRATDPKSRLRAESHVLWPQLSAELLEETGVDNGFLKCGGIGLELPGEPEWTRDEIAAWRAEGLDVEELSGPQLREREPALHPEINSGFLLPEMSQVRNPRHLKALIAGCLLRGVELSPGTMVYGFDRRGEKALAVRTNCGAFPAGQFCVTTGAWSRPLLSEAGCDVRIEPVRGQMVLLAGERPVFRHILEVGSRYMVSRSDGRILAGSTEEWVGFDKRNTAGAVAELIRFATAVVPCLADAAVERTWAGLRPGSADGLPYLGRVPTTENLFVAAGHFRSGLQMSPGTARVMRQLMLGQETAMPLEAFAVESRVEGRGSRV